MDMKLTLGFGTAIAWTITDVLVAQSAVTMAFLTKGQRMLVANIVDVAFCCNFLIFSLHGMISLVCVSEIKDSNIYLKVNIYEKDLS